MNPSATPPVFTRIHHPLEAMNDETPSLSQSLGCQNLGLTLFRFASGEGFPFYHQHKEQEEVYLVLEGRAELRVNDEILNLETGDAVRVSAKARRALGNSTSADTLILVAGAMPHNYPNTEPEKHGDVISDWEMDRTIKTGWTF